ncbi:MAG: hypothetical protein ABI857_04985 [Acidobacteriota bacterium]
MDLSKQIIALVLSPLVLLAFGSFAVAQSDTVHQLEPSYEVTLHVVIGSNEAPTKNDLPASLAGISKHVKGNFSFSNYRLANTFVGRVSNTGTIEYKSVSNILGQETDGESQTFLDWSLGNFRVLQNGFQARSFRFGARVPIRTGTLKDPSGVATPVVNYESIGLTISMIGLPENTPTLIGTISLPKTTGTIFLIATVKAAGL